jgi:hypothetical protein
MELSLVPLRDHKWKIPVQNGWVARGHVSRADLLDASFEAGLIGATGFVMVGGSIDFQSRAGSPDRNISLVTNRVDQLALPNQLSAVFQHRMQIDGK